MKHLLSLRISHQQTLDPRMRLPFIEIQAINQICLAMNL